MKKPQIKKVKPFKPIGNRVSTSSLADNYTAKNRPATQQEIAATFLLHRRTA